MNNPEQLSPLVDTSGVQKQTRLCTALHMSNVAWQQYVSCGCACRGQSNAAVLAPITVTALSTLHSPHQRHCDNMKGPCCKYVTYGMLVGTSHHAG